MAAAKDLPAMQPQPQPQLQPAVHTSPLTPPQYSTPANASNELPLQHTWIVEHTNGSGSAICSVSRAAGLAGASLACDGGSAGPGSSGQAGPCGALTEEVPMLGEVELAPCGPLPAQVLRAGARVSLSEPWTRVASHSLMAAGARAASPGAGNVRVPSGRPCRVLRAASAGSSWQGSEQGTCVAAPSAAAAAGDEGAPLATRVQGGHGGSAAGGLARSVRSGLIDAMKHGEGRGVGGFHGPSGDRGELAPVCDQLVHGGCTVLTVQAAAMSTAQGTMDEVPQMLDTTASIGSDCSPAQGWAAMLGMGGTPQALGPMPHGPRLQPTQPQQDQQQRDQRPLPVLAQAGSLRPPMTSVQAGAAGGGHPAAAPGRFLVGGAGGPPVAQGPSRVQELRTGRPNAAVSVPAPWRPPPDSPVQPSLDLTGSTTSSTSVPAGCGAEAEGTGWSELQEDAAEHSSAPTRAPTHASQAHAQAGAAAMAAPPPPALPSSLANAGSEAAAGAGRRYLSSDASGPANVRQPGAAGINASVSALGPVHAVTAAAAVAPAVSAVSISAPLYTRQAEGSQHNRLMQRVAAPQELTQRNLAALHMVHHMAAGAAGAAGGAGGALTASLPLAQLATLDVGSLSRELRALRWIGQGGGGVVFKGVWQSAPVAVKFMLAPEPQHVNAAALEGVVSSALGHPNVIRTYSFSVARLTAACFAEPQQHTASLFTDGGATELYLALMESAGEAGQHQRPPSSQLLSLPPVPRATSPGSGVHARASRGAEAVLQLQQHAGAGTGAGAEAQQWAPQPEMHASQGMVAVPWAAGYDVPGGASSGGVSITGGGSSGSSTSGEGAVAPHGATALPPSWSGPGRLAGQDCTSARAAAAADATEPALAAGGSGAVAHGAQPGTTPQTQPHRQGQGSQQGAAFARASAYSAFESGDGFGDPDIAAREATMTLSQVLTHLQARPGMYMTHIIMEYCDRGSLLAAIRKGIFRMEGPPLLVDQSGSSAGAAVRFPARLVLRALLRTARDVAQGMQHLHSRGIIHGDLKPGNVLLRGCRADRRGFVAMVADFGLAKVARGEHDQPLEVHHWSTVTIMAPEIILGKWHRASDVYSFGILLWQLLASEPVPYKHLTVPQILLGVAQGTLRPEWPPGAHPTLIKLGRACLDARLERRPSFEAIVKVLTKVESDLRNELKEKTRSRRHAQQQLQQQ